MKRTLLVAASLASSLALAQTENVDVNANLPGMPGINLNVRIKEGGGNREQRTTGVHEEQSGEGFRITWDTDPEGGTWFKVLAPEGLPVTVTEDGSMFPVSRGMIPVSFRAQGKKFYTVQVKSQAATFTRKFEAKTGLVAQLWITGPMQVQQQVVVQQPPPPVQPVVVAAAPVNACGSEADFEGISQAIEGEGFSDGKLRVLEEASKARAFCVDQVIRLIKLYSFSSDKLGALKIVAPRITDRQNNFKIYSAFDFDGDRNEAKKILR